MAGNIFLYLFNVFQIEVKYTFLWYVCIKAIIYVAKWHRKKNRTLWNIATKLFIPVHDIMFITIFNEQGKYFYPTDIIRRISKELATKIYTFGNYLGPFVLIYRILDYLLLQAHCIWSMYTKQYIVKFNYLRRSQTI